MDISVQTTGGVAVVTVLDEILDLTTIDAFLTLVEQVLDEHPNMIVDVGMLHYIDSSGLSGFAYLYNRVYDREGRICIFGARGRVAQAIDMIQLERIMGVYASLDEALGSFQSAAENSA